MCLLVIPPTARANLDANSYTPWLSPHTFVANVRDKDAWFSIKEVDVGLAADVGQSGMSIKLLKPDKPEMPGGCYTSFTLWALVHYPELSTCTIDNHKKLL